MTCPRRPCFLAPCPRWPRLGTVLGRGWNRSVTQRVHSGFGRPESAYVGRRGTTASVRLLRRALSRDRAGRREDPDLSGRRRLPRLPRPARHHRAQTRLAPACLLPDDESLPPRRRGDRRSVVRRVPAVERPLCARLQCPPRPLGPSLRRAVLERCDRGRRGARRGLPVRDRESAARGALPSRRGLALERLALRPATRRRRRS